jgi:hypothetical protein
MPRPQQIIPAVVFECKLHPVLLRYRLDKSGCAQPLQGLDPSTSTNGIPLLKLR